MIISGEQFYCVGCAKMVSMLQADVLFRTGFFKVIHPMGCCVECMVKQEKTQADSISHLKEEGLDGFLPISAQTTSELLQPIAYRFAENLYSTEIV